MERSLLSEPAFTYLSESPVKEPSLQVPLAVVLLRVMHSYWNPFVCLSKSPVNDPTL